MTRENQRNETSILYLDGRENSGDHQHYFNLPYLDVLCFPAVVVSTFFCGSVWQRCAVFMSKQKTRQVCRGVFGRELKTAEFVVYFCKRTLEKIILIYILKTVKKYSSQHSLFLTSITNNVIRKGQLYQQPSWRHLGGP